VHEDSSVSQNRFDREDGILFGANSGDEGGEVEGCDAESSLPLLSRSLLFL
jgi:hypothetical protein